MVKSDGMLGSMMLGCWLILTGLFSLLPVYIPFVADILPLFALIAGVVLLLTSTQLQRSAGVFLLAVWLILKGMMPYWLIYIPEGGAITDVVAMISGVLILFRK